MTLQVHDGSETAEYNTYTSLDAADAYHEARNSTEWIAASEVARKAALVRATDYIDATYRFTCDRLIDDAVNPLLVKATAVMANFALTDTLANSDARDVVEVEKSLEGVGSTRTRYETKKVSDAYPLVTSILAPITTANGGGVTTGRVTR